MLARKRGRPMRKEDNVEASLKGPHVLRLAMSQSTGLRRQLRRIFGLIISRPPPGTELESGIRTQVGQRVPPGVRAGIEDMTGIRRRDTRETLRGAILRAEVGDGSARRSWVSRMTKDT